MDVPAQTAAPPRRSGSQHLLPAGILAGGLVLSLLLGHLDTERLQNEAYLKTTTELATIRARLEGQVRATIGVTEGMVHLLRMDGELSARHFNGLAAQAMAAAPQIRNIALAPDDVVRAVYPLAGNEKVLGTDYRTLPAQHLTVQRARELGSPLLAGPVELVQGGRALIYRHPIFLTDAAGATAYWGTASIVADVDRLLSAGGLNKEAPLALALRGHDGQGSAGAPIWGDPALFARDPVRMDVSVPGGRWQLAATPPGGWPTQTLAGSPLFLFSLANTLLLAYFAAQLARRNRLIQERNSRLSQAMREREQAETALHHHQALLQAIVDHAPSLIYMFDPDGRLKLCNKSFEHAVNHPRDQIEGRLRDQFLPPALARQHRQNDEQVIDAGHSLRFEEQNEEGGRIRTYLTTKCPLRTGDGRLQGVLGISTDITEMKQTTEQLRLAGVVMANTADGVMITDATGTIVSVNKAFTDITGYSADEAVGQTPRILRSDRQDAAFYRRMWHTISRDGFWRGEIWNRRKNGALYPEWLTINAVTDPAGQCSNYVAVFSDISAIKHSQAALERLAHFDPLTDLPNRTLFHDRLQQSLDRVLGHGHELAVLMLDLDGFKTVNDSLGHPVGDLLLQQAAQRFKACLRVEDTVSRFGGDEFAIILGNLTQATDAIAVVKKLLLALREPFVLHDTTALVTTSIGIAIAPGDGQHPEELVRNADTAMYGAKEDGRNNYRFYQADMTRRAQERLNLERALRRALEAGEFEVWYQPKLDLAGGRLNGAEALLRWRDPEHGLISPATFIPMAERTGLIVPIGAQVLEAVCAQLARWREAGLAPGRIAINVAALQIERSDYAQTLREALERHRLPPDALEVEVTESLIMESPAHAREVLCAIQALGITTAVDDFGTGYSSLAYLKLLPINNLKIDRAFVCELPHNENDIAISRAIIALGHSLGFRITAEGIETDAQLAFLREAGCDAGQGYLFGRPMPAPAFETWMAEHAVPAHPAA